MFYASTQVFYYHVHTYFIVSYEVYCLPIERETGDTRQKQVFQKNFPSFILGLPRRVGDWVSNINQLLFSSESVSCPWGNSVLTIHTSAGEKNKTKPTHKRSLQEELNVMRCWFSHSEILPAISVCPDEQTFPGHERSAVDARQKKC